MPGARNTPIMALRLDTTPSVFRMRSQNTALPPIDVRVQRFLKVFLIHQVDDLWLGVGRKVAGLDWENRYI